MRAQEMQDSGHPSEGVIADFKVQRAGSRMFQVGTRMYVTHNPPREDFPRQEITLLGWQEPFFLLTTVPMPSNRYIDGSAWSLRYVLEGRAYGFHTKIIRLFREPFLVMMLKYPTNIEAMNIRKHDRFNTLLIGEVFKGSDTSQVAVCDLSGGGALVQSAWKLESGDNIEMSFVLPDGNGIEHIKCEVKNVRQEKAYYFMGVSFPPDDNPEISKLAKFFQETT